jgi:transcriptional regulator with GAF, ATPase, and Fis domain
MTADNNDIHVIQTNIAVIMEQTKFLPQMNQKINEITNKQSAFEEKFKSQENDIRNLQKKSETWNILNSIGAFIAMVVGSIFGPTK